MFLEGQLITVFDYLGLTQQPSIDSYGKDKCDGNRRWGKLSVLNIWTHLFAEVPLLLFKILF